MVKPFSGDFPITQKWNDPRFRANYLKFGILGHNGLDYGIPNGTPILAPHAGKVVEAASDPDGYGNYVKIENDVEGSVLGHLQTYSVKVGDSVNESQQVGVSDNTGNSTGPHLHWGYYRLPRNRDNGFNGYIDQTDWLNLKMPVLEITDQTKIPQVMDMEVQAIRSVMGDQKNTIESQDKQIIQLTQRVLNLQWQLDALNSANNQPSEQNPPETGTQDQSVLRKALLDLISKIMQIFEGGR